jgi:hypothetical protein
MVQGKKINLGHFAAPEAAYASYQSAAYANHGAFANTGVPNSGAN